MYYLTYSSSAFVSVKVVYGSNKSTVSCLRAQQETGVMEEEVGCFMSPAHLLLFLLLQLLPVSFCQQELEERSVHQRAPEVRNPTSISRREIIIIITFTTISARI